MIALARPNTSSAGLGIDWFENAGHSLAGGGGSRIALSIGGYGYRTKDSLGIANWHDYSIGGAITCRPNAVTVGDGGYPWVLRNVLRPGMVGVTAAGGAPYNPQSQLVNVHYGLNDLGILGAAKPLPWQTALRTIIARFCASSVFEVEPAGASSAQWAFTGTWTDMSFLDSTAACSGTGLRYTATVNDKATFTVPTDCPAGRVIGIGLFLNSAWGVQTYGVKIDGVSFPDLVLDPAAMTDQTIANMHIIHTLRIGTGIAGDPYGTPLAAGTHTIELTFKSGTALGPDFAHIEADPLDGPVLLCPLPNRPANYSIWSGWPGGPSMTDTVIDQWKTYERAILAEFPGRVISDSHGLGIDLDDANLNRNTPSTDPVNADFISDGAHPNDRGHGKWVDLVSRIVRNSPLITDRVRSRAFVDPRPRAWKKVGQVNGAGVFNTNWSNYGNAAFYDLQWRIDEKRHVYVRGAAKAAAGATITILVANTLPKSAGLLPFFFNRFDGTTWTPSAIRNTNNGVLALNGAASTTAGNIHEFNFDYQAEL